MPDSHTTHAGLRDDLQGFWVGRGSRRSRMVIDDIGGKFAKIPEDFWRSLQSGVADRNLWAQASSAGWTRNQRKQPVASRSPLRWFQHPQSLLAVRVPLFHFERFAQRLAWFAGWLFTAKAACFFLFMMCGAVAFCVAQYREVAYTAQQLPSLFSAANAVGIGLVFVLTKLVHELGHAIACHRVGARCGEIGVIFFFGIPCPYCDVTQLWRVPQWWRRAGVMAAGMYVEGIVATTATLVWALADTGSLRLHAMNVMIICSVSTLLFNANPLMKYDGYYVLADWLRSVDLRGEARRSLDRLCSRPRLIVQRRTAGLSCFHVASTVYRGLVTVAIASMIVAWAESTGLRLLAVTALISLVIVSMCKAIGRVSPACQKLWNRRGIVQPSPECNPRPVRKWGRKLGGTIGKGIIGAAVVLSLGGLLCVPLPRRIHVSGFVDAQDTAEVFLTANGMVQAVLVEFGQPVDRGDVLCSIGSDELDLRSIQVAGQLGVASLRSRAIRRQTLESAEASSHLQSLEAVEQSLRASLVLLENRRSRLQVTAPASGVIIPVLDRSRAEAAFPWDTAAPLGDRIGRRSDRGTSWCRIARNDQLAAVFNVDARYRDHLTIGDLVNGYQEQAANEIESYRISMISSARSTGSGSIHGLKTTKPAGDDGQHHAVVQVVCHPVESASWDAQYLLSRLGSSCHGIITLPPRSLGDDLIQFLKDLVS